MTQPVSRDIVVALDGSLASREAARWAAWQSQLTRQSLVLLHAYAVEDAPRDRAGEFHVASESWHRSHATRWLQAALDECPAIPYAIHLVVLPGAWGEALRARALAGAELVVVGAGTDAGTALQEGPALHCPVVVVPGPDAETCVTDGRESSARPARRLVATP